MNHGQGLFLSSAVKLSWGLSCFHWKQRPCTEKAHEAFRAHVTSGPRAYALKGKTPMMPNEGEVRQVTAQASTLSLEEVRRSLAGGVAGGKEAPSDAELELLNQEEALLACERHSTRKLNLHRSSPPEGVCAVSRPCVKIQHGSCRRRSRRPCPVSYCEHNLVLCVCGNHAEKRTAVPAQTRLGHVCRGVGVLVRTVARTRRRLWRQRFGRRQQPRLRCWWVCSWRHVLALMYSSPCDERSRRRLERAGRRTGTVSPLDLNRLPCIRLVEERSAAAAQATPRFGVAHP